MEKLNLYSNLLRDLSLMLTNSNDYDVIIQVGENQNKKEFRAHSNILKARSEYFKVALSEGWIIKKNDLIEFKKSNINPIIFEVILRYLYTGELHLTKKLQDVNTILELIIASDELLIEELLDCVQDYLIKIRPTLVREELDLVLHRVFRLSNCKKLQDHCVDSILSQSFITSKNFLSLQKDILYELLKRDDFLIEEIIIWEYLIKWGIEQTPGLGSENSDRTKWNDENYEALKETLNQLIPLIRFSYIKSTDFYDKVHPFKAVIPNRIYEEAFEFYMKGTLPAGAITFLPRVGMIHIESKIIKPKDACIIANWIEGKDAKIIRSGKDPQYEFNLLYRKSRDGLNCNLFCNMYKTPGPYLILIKPQSNAQNDTATLDAIFQPRRNNTRTIYRNFTTNRINYDLSDWDSWEQKSWDSSGQTNSTKIYGKYLSSGGWDEAESFMFTFADGEIKKRLMNHSSFDFRMCRQGYSYNNVIEGNHGTFIPEEFEVFEVGHKL